MLFLGSLLSIVVECKNNIATQRSIVSSFMKSLDPDYPDENNEMSTHLAGGGKNPGDYIIKGVEELTSEDYPHIEEYFLENVIPLIKENEIGTVVKSVYLLIRDDTDINDETVVDIINGTQKKNLVVKSDRIASFLAGVFLYVLKNTENRQKKGFAKETAKKYVDMARNVETIFPEQKETKNYDVITERKSRVRFFVGEAFTSISVAILVTEWDEKNSFDMAIIEGLACKKYSDVYEDLRSQGETIIKYEKGVINCSIGEESRYQLAEDLDEHHFQKLFDSVGEEIDKHTEYDVCSSKCLESIFDFLTYYGCYMKDKSRIEPIKWRNLLFGFLNSCFSNKTAIERLLEKLPVIVEADPDTVLSVIEQNLYEKQSFLNSCLKHEDNASIAYPLANLVRKTAAFKTTFAGAMGLLFEMVRYNNVFLENIRYVLTPYYLQTEAQLESREGVLKSFFRKNEEIAWKLLVSLMHGNSFSTLERMTFRYYPIRMIEVSKDDYGQEIERMVNLACLNLKGRVDRAIELIQMSVFLSVRDVKLISDSVIKEIRPSSGTIEILRAVEESLRDLMEPEKKTVLKQLCEAYTINKEELSGRNAFNYSFATKKTDEQIQIATVYVQSLYQKGGFDQLITGFGTVKDITFYCNVIRKVLKDEEFRHFCYHVNDTAARSYLPLLLDSFSSEELVAFFDKDDSGYVDMLCAHPCDGFMVNYIESLPEEMKAKYWNKVCLANINDVNPKQLKNLVRLTMKNDNYTFGIKILRFSLQAGFYENLVEMIINVLQKYSFFERAYPYCYQNDNDIRDAIQELILFAQDHSSDLRDEIADIEEKYIKIFRTDKLNRVKRVFYKMANNPEYVERLIIRKHQSSQAGNYDMPEALLLYRFKITPGYLPDGSFDYSGFCKWYEYALHSAVKDEMIKLFGTTLYHAESVEGDFFMNIKVVEFLESQADQNLLTLFEVEALNSIGMVDLNPKLQVYDNLFKDFTIKAVKCEEEGYIRMSRVFRRLASIIETHNENI